MAEEWGPQNQEQVPFWCLTPLKITLFKATEHSTEDSVSSEIFAYKGKHIVKSYCKHWQP